MRYGLAVPGIVLLVAAPAELRAEVAIPDTLTPSLAPSSWRSPTSTRSPPTTRRTGTPTAWRSTSKAPSQGGA